MLIWFWAPIGGFGPLTDEYGPLMSHVGGLHGVGVGPSAEMQRPKVIMAYG